MHQQQQQQQNMHLQQMQQMQQMHHQFSIGSASAMLAARPASGFAGDLPADVVRWLHVMQASLHAVSCSAVCCSGMCCMLHAACCTLHAICCLLHAACCMLLALCCVSYPDPNSAGRRFPVRFCRSDASALPAIGTVLRLALFGA
jgi:hypothetical protein